MLEALDSHLNDP